MAARISKQGALVALAITIFGGGLSTAEAETCEGKELFIVGLKIRGNPEDSFRIIGLCGNEEIVRCRATVEEGNTRDRCTAAAELPVGTGGRKRCVIGPRNGNSATAAVVERTCDVQ